MIRNIQITKKGNESDNQSKTLFTSPNPWEEGGSNLVLYKNNAPLVKDRDYTVQDENTIQLFNAAKTSDEFNFIITQMVDPSEMYSADERMHQVDKINKKFEGKASTSIKKRVTEETIPSNFIIHSDEIWTSDIDPDVKKAQRESTALGFSMHTLTQDNTVAEKKGWYASEDDTIEKRIINWIPPSFGKSYYVRLFDQTGQEIPSSDPMNWRWDYQAGYLTIENDFDYPTPLKISGWKYNGRTGVGSGSYWKEPIFSVADLPLYHNDDGDIRLILTENILYRFDSIADEWFPLNYGSQAFRDPVLNKEDLPTSNSMRGDVRLVMNESNLYVFDDSVMDWVLLTGQGFNPSNYYDRMAMDSLLALKADKNHTHDTLYYRKEQVENLVRWRPSREDFNDLPPHTENQDGDVILTRDDNSIWRWYTDDPNSGQGHWDRIIQSNFSWKTPVTLYTDLPIGGNSPGDARLVTDEQKIYFWAGDSWAPIVSEVEDHHHDDRYLLKTQLHWKAPVDTFDDLPDMDNDDGDCRITLDTNIIYRWSYAEDAWLEVVKTSSWLDPVFLLADLPLNANENDVIFVKEFNRLYVFDGAVWQPLESADHEHNDLYYTKSEIDNIVINIINDISSHTHDGIDSEQIDYNNLLNLPQFFWKNPVSFFEDLPLSGNATGDARIVLDTKSIYVWVGDWELISGGTIVTPDHDHDDRYHRKQEVAQLIENLRAQINLELSRKSSIFHNHDDRYYTKSEVDIALEEKADEQHSHNDLYYTKNQVDSELFNKADKIHDHDDTYAQIDDLRTPGAIEVTWENIINAPDFTVDGGSAHGLVIQKIHRQVFENNAGQSLFELEKEYTTEGLFVWLNGVLQKTPEDYSEISETEIEMVDPLNEDDRLIVIIFYNDFDIDIAIHRDEFQNVAGQSLFELTHEYAEGNIFVFQNGVLQKTPEDYVEISSTEIQMVDPLREDESLVVLIFRNQTGTSSGGSGGTNYYSGGAGCNIHRQEFVDSMGLSLLTLDQAFDEEKTVVYKNGSLLRLGVDYHEIPDNQIQLVDSLTQDDVVVVFIHCPGVSNISIWKTPVQSFEDLPQLNNQTGDLRLVLDTSEVWSWENYTWVLVGEWSIPVVDFWEAPVVTFNSLPTAGNTDGDVRLVKDENVMYRWDSDVGTWVSISGGSGGNVGASANPFIDIQVYINGIQGREGIDWYRLNNSVIRVQSDTMTEHDIVTVLLFLTSNMYRYDVRGKNSGSVDVILDTSFYRKEFEIANQTKTFTTLLPFNPGCNDLVVWVNGVLQSIGKDYFEVSNHEFEFYDPLQPGDRIIIVILGFKQGEDNYYREDYTINEDDVLEFTLQHDYEPGLQQLLVYLNGNLQHEGDDYFEENERTIRFARVLNDTDYLTFIILKGSCLDQGGNIILFASDLRLGYPTDGSWSDGYIQLDSEMNVADAIDGLNEAILEIIPQDLVSIQDIALISEDIDFVSGFVSAGNDYIEGLPGDYFDYLTKDRTFYLYTPDNSFPKADQGVLNLYVNGTVVDSFDLGAAFVESDRNGPQIPSHYGIKTQGASENVGVPGVGGSIRGSVNGYIQIMSVEKFQYRMIQKGKIKLKLHNGVLRHGYNYVRLEHQYDGVTNSTKTFKAFIDTKHVFPSFTGLQTFFEQNVNSSKYVSGIRYYSIGDEFKVTLTVVNNFYTVYSPEIISIDMPGLKPYQIEYNDADLRDVSDPPHIDDVLEYRRVFSLNEFNEYSIDGVPVVNTHTPFGDGEEYVFVSKNRLINTYTNGSTPLIEYFRDEIYRLPAGSYDNVPVQKLHVWDSTRSLVDGEAMIFDKGLRYANMSFEDYMPEQVVDYSSFTGPQEYYRSFYKSEPRNNGIFIIQGITKNDLTSNKINIDIKLPTQTGWLSLNNHYHISEFNGQDGDGCLIDVVDDRFYFSTGTFSTAYSGYLLVVRITLPNDLSPAIKYMELTW